LPDEEVWWPYNTKETTAAIARQAGWEVIFDDLNLCERDGLIVLKRWQPATQARCQRRCFAIRPACAGEGECGV
jgi:hypothetical protein